MCTKLNGGRSGMMRKPVDYNKEWTSLVPKGKDNENRQTNHEKITLRITIKYMHEKCVGM